jgi:hypothetical protein
MKTVLSGSYDSMVVLGLTAEHFRSGLAQITVDLGRQQFLSHNGLITRDRQMKQHDLAADSNIGSHSVLFHLDSFINVTLNNVS